MPANRCANQFAGYLTGGMPVPQRPKKAPCRATYEKGRARREAIMAFIVDYLNEHGFPPSIKEMGEAVGLSSSSTVHSHLTTLEASGELKRDKSKPRCTYLPGSKRQTVAGLLDTMRELLDAHTEEDGWPQWAVRDALEKALGAECVTMRLKGEA